ncbi:carboxymuconolactone decarboxylase family protein [Gracilibacillus alcaliphilus]|uniref:carboxymuconolactone decarboxylase family protein n=1 Tax=Gracilibacillus alcaliphilus TaxID=1401441 RepID=UPI00195EDD2A|nr:carboxymuconolactone decarboxylase family protein [Gracilibacillus alcaliphilus]MBM7675290.1 AhpD family alkylhydroperoxidase [Gracilibacillus alcaliphilus]
MTQRMNYFELAPEAVRMMREIEKYTRKSSIDRTVQELVKIRASQINGCAFCINMHTAEARQIGVTEQRLYCISAWRDCMFYSDKEKAALELAEQITLISESHVSDHLYQHVRQYYTEKEYLDLIVLINQINSWNRLSIAAGNMAE